MSTLSTDAFQRPPAAPPRTCIKILFDPLILICISSLVIMALSCYDISAATTLPVKPVLDSDNHASFRNGARVLHTLTSPSVPVPFAGLYASTFENPYISLLARDGFGPSVPEAALGLLSDDRALWFFNHTPGVLTVALPAPVVVHTIRIMGHASKISCQPREVNVWGLVAPPDALRIDPRMFTWPDFPSLLQEAPTVAVTWSASIIGTKPKERWIPIGQSNEIPLASAHHDFAVTSIVTKERIAVHAVALEFRRNWGGEHHCVTRVGLYSSSPDP